MNSATRWLVPILILFALIAAWWSVAERRRDAIVVYCAHDLIFSQSILEQFERETGIKVVIVGDTEATKSLGLTQRLLVERDHPRCDVFWNNQVLGTAQLAEEGILLPYKGSGYSRIP
ncbi:MAG: ABC transporter substrate-binding protein, partial [Planctomycetaceae bacterium]|nr:ABC transporter substrate-binding protein [Planctomycetaceae bacterium]